MIRIERLSSKSHHLKQLYCWCEELWGPFEPFEPFKNGLRIPEPILAFEDEILIGGLICSAYASPETGDMALWINALFVKSDKRRMGVGSKLIGAVEKVARDDHKIIYVKTHIPSLYIKSNWSKVTDSDGDVILKKDLA